MVFYLLYDSFVSLSQVGIVVSSFMVRIFLVVTTETLVVDRGEKDTRGEKNLQDFRILDVKDIEKW